MNFDQLNDIIAREAGINICPICGVPFEKYHSRQKSCGDADILTNADAGCWQRTPKSSDGIGVKLKRKQDTRKGNKS